MNGRAPLYVLPLDGRSGPARRLTEREARDLVANALGRAQDQRTRSAWGLRVPSAAAVALGVLALSGGAGASFMAVHLLEPVVIRIAAPTTERAPLAPAPIARKPRAPEVRTRAVARSAPVAPAPAPPLALLPQPRVGAPSAVASHAQAAAPAAGGLAAANRLRATGAWSEARDAYARVARGAHPGDPEREAATLAVASLELEHLGRPRAALARYSALAGARAAGIAEEAAWAIAECHRRLGHRDAEAAALRLFLVRHPASLLRARAEARLRALDGSN